MHYKKDKPEWLEFDLLTPYPHVSHGVFERHGGVSDPPYESLNLANEVGDHAACVKVNREKILASLGIDHLVFPHQTHGTGIARITSENKDQIHQADALITTEKNIGLAVSHADCQGAIFFDPEHQAIAVAHVGWRGNVQNLYEKLVHALKEQIKTNPKHLLVCISPSLGPDHAEFTNYKQELPEDFWSYQVKPHYFDFWAISKSQLTRSGIPEKNIEIAQICTVCTPNDYFSYRRDHRTGRNATVVALKN